MPRHKDLKRLVRARMARTGESYTTARRGLVGSPPAAVIEADAAALAHVLRTLGVTNPATTRPFEVHELFGIGGGIGFAYFVFEYPEFTSVFTGCAINEFVLGSGLIEHACDALTVPYRVHTTKSPAAAERQLNQVLDDSGAAIVSVDRTFLGHEGLGEELRGMVPLNVVVERGAGGLQVTHGRHVDVWSSTQLAAAREAVSSQKHRLVALTPAGAIDVTAAVTSGIEVTRRGLVEPPRTNFGLEGLRRWRDAVASPGQRRGWTRLFDDDEKLSEALDWAQFWISEDGTGAGFRTLYGDFLTFAQSVTDRPELGQLAADYSDVGGLWRQLASLEEPDLAQMAQILDEVVTAETDLATRL